MRGISDPQSDLFSYVSLESLVPADHPLRRFRQLVDVVLASMDDELSALYSRVGRPSIPPEHLLRAALLQVLYTIRSERMLVEQLDYNLLFRWFVGLSMDDRVWDHSTFSQNRDRLFNQDVARLFFERVRALAEWSSLTSDEHFTVDGTLIDAWASHKSFVRRDDDTPSSGGGRNVEADFRGQSRSNATHVSRTDPEARLARKSDGDASRLCHMAHLLTDNAHGLVVDVEVTAFSGTAERDAAKAMLHRVRRARRATVGADRGYDTRDFIASCRAMGITPHVAQKSTGSAIDGRTTRQAGYKTSQRQRKRIEEVFGWLKTVAGLRKTRLIGHARLAGQVLLATATYNLIRMGTIGGWWRGAHV